MCISVYRYTCSLFMFMYMLYMHACAYCIVIYYIIFCPSPPPPTPPPSLPHKVICLERLEWPVEYTREKVLPLLSQWTLREAAVARERGTVRHSESSRPPVEVVGWVKSLFPDCDVYVCMFVWTACTCTCTRRTV